MSSVRHIPTEESEEEHHSVEHGGDATPHITPFIPPQYETLDAFQKDVFQKMMNSVRLSNSISNMDDYMYYSTFKPFKVSTQKAGQQVLALFANLLSNSMDKKSNIPRELLENPEEGIESYDSVIDVLDILLEEADSYMDEAKGEKTKDKVVYPTSMVQADSNSYTQKLRPQIHFDRPVDNTTKPFKPFLTEKPHALKPLPPVFQQGRVLQEQASEDGDQQNIEYPHPYEFEIKNVAYMPAQLHDIKETPYKELSETPCTWVETPDVLDQVIKKLLAAKEIAVDLEQHDYRSYLGFNCLMQISTRDEDFLIDSISLRSELVMLNAVFANPNIIKVLHGCDSDVIWLQRDHSLYLVNVFDTGQAARVLSFPRFSLAYLLQHFCGVIADKKYQLADWRIRPLTAEMLRYAREDTHYLLYIYDRLRNQLLERGADESNLLLTVLDRSNNLCLKKFTKPVMDENKFAEFLSRHQDAITNELRRRIFHDLFFWRDEIARKEDESWHFVLPNRLMIRIAQAQPQDVVALSSLATPLPPIVRQRAEAILAIVSKAKKQIPLEAQSTPITISQERRKPVFPDAPNLAASDEPKTPRKQMISEMTPSGLVQESPAIDTEELFRIAGWSQSQVDLHLQIGQTQRAISFFTTASSSAASLYREPDEDADGDEGMKIAAEIYRNLTYKARALRQQPQALDDDSDDSPTDEADPPKTKETEESTDSIFVPSNFTQIFQLSNYNRKRNKEKRKNKDEPATGDDGEMNENLLDEDGAFKTKKQKGHDDAANIDDGTVEFLKSIGWVQSNEDIQRLRGDADEDVPGSDRSEAEDDPRGFSRTSKVSPTTAATQQQQRDFFKAPQSPKANKPLTNTPTSLPTTPQSQAKRGQMQPPSPRQREASKSAPPSPKQTPQSPSASQVTPFNPYVGMDNRQNRPFHSGNAPKIHGRGEKPFNQPAPNSMGRGFARR